MRADELPRDVQAAVIALAADAVGRMPAGQLPVAVRRSASFAPARRAKLAGRQIAEAVASDDEFRERVARHLRSMEPGDIAGVEAAQRPPPAHLARTAAVAFLARPEGWEDVVKAAIAAAAEQSREREPTAQQAAAMERLNSQLVAARSEVKQQREKLRSQLDSVKQDNASLRRTLGQTRAELRAAVAATERAQAEQVELRRCAEVVARETAAEVRRLRVRITELESESNATRRVARQDRDAEVVRLRLLLETLAEATSGMRRELALPATSTLPADGVSALEPGTVSGVSQVGRALLSDDPVLLRRLLELPRLHLVVDGYNVSKEAWPQASLEQQRTRLMSGLAGLVGGKGVETTVVFDGADLLHVPVVTAPRSVRVRFSPPGVIADDIIRQLVAAEPTGRPVVVVSTDREVAESVTKMGARSVASAALVAVLGR